MKLHKMGLKEVIQDTPYYEMPVEMEGNHKEINEYCESKGYKWKEEIGLMFGGYWVDPETLNCYIPMQIKKDFKL